jgi:hypothetical protein
MSSPIKLVVNVGEEKKVNITSKEYYDLSIYLISVNSTNANMIITKINEPIMSKAQQQNQTEQIKDNTSSENKNKNGFDNLMIIYISIVFVIFLFIGIRIYIRYGKNNRKSGMNHKLK